MVDTIWTWIEKERRERVIKVNLLENKRIRRDEYAF
jgi:hypothetical protein